MKAKPKHNLAWLLATARAVARELKRRSAGTRLRIRIPRGDISTNTDGWRVRIGDLGKNQPKLEVWLDRFTGHSQRKLWACFSSYKSRPPILAITKRVSRRLWPTRVLTTSDIKDGGICALAIRLNRHGFNAPILEKYDDGLTFYGVYDPTRDSTEGLRSHFCTRAAAFFEDVARALPGARGEDEQRDVYPQFENRKRVASHLRRERSKLLAAECKIRDHYACQVCGLLFEDAYGRLGSEFAEAHHLVPLGQLRENVKTRLEDLATVCANCHRMLHRMEGKLEDMKRLKAIFRKHNT